MGKFATPKWDTNEVADELCNSLFKGKNKNKIKKTGKLKNSGKIVKAKLNKAKEELNKKIVKKVGKNLSTVKNVVNKKKNELLKKKDNSNTEQEISNTSVTNESNTSAKKLSKKRNKVQKANNLPNFKHLKNMLEIKLKEEEDQKMLFGEDTITETNTVKTKQKNKVKKKKLESLKNDITEKVEADISKVKKKMKRKKKKSLLTEPDNKEDLNETLNSNSADDTDLLRKKSGKVNKKLSLRERMLERLKASRFRYLNEQLYNSPSKEAENFFKSDPEAFGAYHEGFRQQVDKWPINPVDVIIKNIKKMNKTHVIADFGCGDAKIAQEVQQKVYSFDLIATNERVTACDMAKVPLAKESVDVAVFCLSLMGTNLQDYLKEANRVLKIGGMLKIAEVESRFDNVDEFIKGVQHFGFKNIHKDLSHNIFYFIDFKKVTNVKKTKGLPTLSLHPCMYKKR